MTETATQTALLVKLHEAAQAIDFIQKRGENKHHNYNFVQAVDVVARVREELLSRGVVVIPGAYEATHLTYQARSGTAFLTTVGLSYIFRDVETGQSIKVPWVGVGADTGGDKGIYKAYTGGLKYALLSLFLIPTSDDPEGDQLTVSPSDPQTHPDDTRPAAPFIPLDRAEAILKTAIALGLAEWDHAEPGPPTVALRALLRARLAQEGVQKIGELSVDQAEAIELFLANEAQAG